MDYLDFELEIGAAMGSRYPVAVLHSPAGEAREFALLPALDPQIRRGLAHGRDAVLVDQDDKPSRAQSVKAFGGALFEAVFSGSVRARFEATRQAALSGEAGVRLRLRIRAPEAAALPWETLYDAERDMYLARSSTFAVSHYLELPLPVKPLAVPAPLRVLGVISAPRDAIALQVNAERALIEAATAELRSQGMLEIHWLEGAEARIERLQDYLQGGVPWHVLHFIGHGKHDADAGQGHLAFIDDTGAARWIDGEALGALAGGHPSLRLVVLNCCRGAEGSDATLFGNVATRVARGGVPAVVAMQRAVSDAAATQFAARFYRATADGLPLDAAVSASREAMWIAATDPNDAEWCLPVLHMRSTDGQLFRIAPPAVTPSPESALPPHWRPRWFLAAFVGVGALLFGLAALPLAYLLADEPQFRRTYIEAYPALFLFFAFVPLALFALLRPTQALIGRVVVDRDRRRRRLFAFSCVVFLVGFPGYAALSELYKQWVAPWEVVHDDSFAVLESFRDPRGGSPGWPAAFFALSDRSLASDPSWGRAQLQQEYAQVFANTQLRSGKLHISRAGKAHYLAVASVAFVIAVLLLNITWLLAYWRRAPASRVAPDVFRSLSVALICLVTWVLMRVSTAEVDALVFGASSVFEQLLPAAIATAAALALALVGLKDYVRSEWLATFAIVSGPATLVAAYAARATIAALFSDLRMCGACFILLLLVVVFLVGSKPNRDAAPGDAIPH